MADTAVNWDEGSFHDPSQWEGGSFSDENKAPGAGEAAREAVQTMKHAAKSVVDTDIELGKAALRGELPGVAARAAGSFVENIASLAAAVPLAAAETAATGGDFAQNVREAPGEIMSHLPDLTEKSPVAEKVVETAGEVGNLPGQLVGDIAYDLTGKPIAGAAGQVVGNLIAPGGGKAKAQAAAKATERAVADAAAAKMKTVTDTVGAVSRAANANDQLGAALQNHAVAHATEKGIQPNITDHIDAAVDAISDADHQNLSARYKALRQTGLSEGEVKAALKQHLRDTASRVAPEAKPVDQAASSVREAFGTSEPPKEEAPSTAQFGDDLAKQRSGLMPGPTEAQAARMADLDQQIAAEQNKYVKGVLTRERKTIQDVVDRRDASLRLHQMAIDALKGGDRELHDRMMAESQKLSGEDGKTSTPEVGESEHIDVESPDVKDVASKPEPVSPSIAAARKEVQDLRQAPSTEGLQVGEAEDITLETPKPMEALPAPAKPVTSGAQAAGSSTELDAAMRDATPNERARMLGYPGDHPEEAPPNTVVDRAVGLAGGKSKDGSTTYISRKIPQYLEVTNRAGEPVVVPVWKEIAAHEGKEFPKIEQLGYDSAHDNHGNAATSSFLEKYDVDPRAYQNALRPYIHDAELDAIRHPDAVPQDLDHRPYAKGFAYSPAEHLLGEKHPWNRMHAGNRRVADRQAARDARLKELEAEHANRDSAKPAADSVSSGDQVRSEEAKAGDQEKVGASNASPVRSDQGQVHQGRDSGGRGEDARGKDIQRTPKARSGTGDRTGEASRDTRTQEVISDEKRTNQEGAKGADGGQEGQRSSAAKATEAAAGERRPSGDTGPGEAVSHADKNAGERQGVGDQGSQAEEAAAGERASGAGEAADEGSAGAGEAGDSVEFNRGDHVRRGMLPKTVQQIAEHVTRNWHNAPKINIIGSMDEAHPSVLKEYRRQQAGGARGAPVAWHHNGTITLNASALRDTRHVLENIFHETVGHYGVQGAFGDRLGPMLDHVVKNNEADVRAKAASYGLDWNKLSDRRKAAEEVLARLAEQNPKLPVVRRALAAIRSWLRDHIPQLKGMSFTDDELVHHFLAPAKRFVERGLDMAHDGETAGAPNAALDPAANSPAFARGGLVAPPPEARDITWNMFRERLAKVARYTETADAKLEPARKLIDTMIGKDYQKVKDAYHEYETTGRTTTLPELNPVFQEIKRTGDAIHAAIVATGKPLGYIQNHLVHAYKDPKKAEQWFSDYFRKNPLTKAGFTKERYYDTLRDAEAAGLEPLSKNIIDTQMMRWAQMKQYEQMHAHRADLEARGWLQSNPSGAFGTPTGWAKVNDPLFQDYLVPEGVARDLNNYLNPGIDRETWWKTYRGIQGGVTSVNLGLSAFHPLATTFDLVSSRLQSTFERLARGQFDLAAKEVVHLPGDLVSAFTAAAGKGRGHELQSVWRGLVQGDPVTQLIANMAEKGGARGQMMPTSDGIAWTQMQRKWRQRDLLAAGGQGLKALMENTGPVIHHQIVPAQKWIAKDILIRLELDKRAKALGVKPGDYQAIGSLMSDDATRQIMARAVDAVDDRLGQYTYVNRRINKMVLTGLQAGLRSPGWFMGGVNTMLGPVMDLRRLADPEKLVAPLDKAGNITNANMGRLTSRVGYLATMMSAYAMLNGGINYELGQSHPEHGGIKDWRDYFSIRFPDGHRFIPASYAKEFFELTRAPLHRVESAASPVIHIASQGLGAIMAAMGTDTPLNRDYFGNMNIDPDADHEKQFEQLVKWAGKQVTPFALSGSGQIVDGTPTEKLLPYLGFPTAPKALTNTAFQEFVENRYYAHKSAGNLPPEQAERKHAISDAIKMYKVNPDTDLSSFTAKEREQIKRYAKGDVESYRFSQLTLRQQLQAWDKASDEEKEKLQLRKLIQHKYLSKAGQEEIRSMDADNARKVREQIRATRQ
jgi:hypothetical protein